jgi:hypothetical protein
VADYFSFPHQMALRAGEEIVPQLKTGRSNNHTPVINREKKEWYGKTRSYTQGISRYSSRFSLQFYLKML